MGKKWMPITVGVLEIIHGVYGILGGLIGVIIKQHGLIGAPSVYQKYEFVEPLHIIFGMLAIVGSVYAFKCKGWWLVLIGAVSTFILGIIIMINYWILFPSNNFFSLYSIWGFLGIPAIVAIILTVLARKQFERK